MFVENLKPQPCPGCDAILYPRESAAVVPPATTFLDCWRRCDKCGIGLSNGRTPGNETLIYMDPRDNIPAEVRDGFLAALARGISEVNRLNKASKAAFSSSEDALTWTVFRYLQSACRLRETTAALDIVIARTA